MDFNKILDDTLKKTAIFTITADYIGDEEIRQMILDICEILKINKAEDREEELTEYFIDAFDALNVEIEEKEAEHLARIIMWEYEEFLNGKCDTYKSIVSSNQPKHKIINESSSEED